jgi:hypothetical protein
MSIIGRKSEVLQRLYFAVTDKNRLILLDKWDGASSCGNSESTPKNDERKNAPRRERFSMEQRPLR